MEHLTIQTFVQNAEQFDADERTPFAEMPWRASSEIIWREGGDTTPIIQGEKTFEYFLEPSIVMEVRESLQPLDSNALVERIIQYAENDA